MERQFVQNLHENSMPSRRTHPGQFGSLGQYMQVMQHQAADRSALMDRRP